MNPKEEHEIEKGWKKYLPLKYVTKFPIQKPPIIPKTVKSSKHQTDQYHAEGFYKVVSKIM